MPIPSPIITMHAFANMP